ncbi:hypothetical protein I5907_03010 [Panacibacter sp. DH6]|uniref:Uncharacterized protein n=1 Tax=Panacibacter microcysteis TaxID=2793269 RepID=A0A931E4V1_9BACT|nr:hypothetical protein [Panacibacter microcysteis]MBG9375184.1 hypothetical protein [Panacibacter microcysteis]
MRNASIYSKSLLVACLLITVIGALAWQTDDKKKNKGSANKIQRDTIIPRRYDYDSNEFRIKDLDIALDNLDIGLKELNDGLKDLHIDIAKTVKEAMASIDLDKISRDVEIGLSKVDFQEIEKEVERELKNINLGEIKIEVQKSLKEAQNEIKKIDKQKLQNEMKELQITLNKNELKADIDKAMQDARKEIEKAKQEIKDLKSFTSALENDGLIDRKKGYTVEWTKDGDLIINGKLQPKEVADKYRRFYKKDGYKIKIRPDDDLEIDGL